MKPVNEAKPEVVSCAFLCIFPSVRDFVIFSYKYSDFIFLSTILIFGVIFFTMAEILTLSLKSGNDKFFQPFKRVGSLYDKGRA